MASQVPFMEETCQKLKDLPGSIKQSYQEFNCINCMKQFRSSNRMIVLVVFIAIYIDNMLTTAVGKSLFTNVVPITKTLKILPKHRSVILILICCHGINIIWNIHKIFIHLEKVELLHADNDITWGYLMGNSSAQHNVSKNRDWPTFSTYQNVDLRLHLKARSSQKFPSSSGTLLADRLWEKTLSAS